MKISAEPLKGCTAITIGNKDFILPGGGVIELRREKDSVSLSILRRAKRSGALEVVDQWPLGA